MYFYTSLINLLHYFKICFPINIKITCQEASQVVIVVKNQPANTGDIRDAGLIPGSGRSLEEGMAIHSSILAWRIPWTGEPGGYSP